MNVSDQTSHRVFISYSSEDRPRVDGLDRLLVLFGHEVFLDFKHIRLGARWKDEIRMALDRTDITLLFWTRSASASPWVRNEYEYCLTEFPDRPLVPIIGDETPLPEQLRERQATTFVPVINELLERKRTMEAEGRTKAEIQAEIQERLQEAGIRLEESDLRRAFRLFGVAGWLAWLPAPLVLFDWVWRSMFEATTQLSRAQAILMITSVTAAATIGAQVAKRPAANEEISAPLTTPPVTVGQAGFSQQPDQQPAKGQPKSRMEASENVENRSPSTSPRSSTAAKVGVAPVEESAATEDAIEARNNLAASVNGGTLVGPPAAYDNRWKAENLIDGTLDGCYAAPTKHPISFVLGFRDLLPATISKVQVFPFTNENSSNWVRSVQIEIADQYPFTGFRAITTLPVSPFGKNEYELPQPVKARFVRFNLLANGGGLWMELGEVRVIGELIEDQPPSPPLTNVALQQNGGKVVEVTSEHSSDYPATELIDGAASGCWCSASSEKQTVVLQLGSPTRVKFICVNPYSSNRLISEWVREVEVEICDQATPVDFESVGRIEIDAIGRDHVLELTAARPTRFVKIVCLKNGGGNHITMGEIKVFGTTLDGADATVLGSASSARN